jgi:hypothetical protein
MATEKETSEAGIMSKQRAAKIVRDIGIAAVIGYCASRVTDQAAE